MKTDRDRGEQGNAHGGRKNRMRGWMENASVIESNELTYTTNCTNVILNNLLTLLNKLQNVQHL